MKKQLEILLEQLEDVENPSVAEEQYGTPPPLAAELLTLAHSPSLCLNFS